MSVKLGKNLHHPNKETILLSHSHFGSIFMCQKAKYQLFIFMDTRLLFHFSSVYCAIRVNITPSISNPSSSASFRLGLSRFSKLAEKSLGLGSKSCIVASVPIHSSKKAKVGWRLVVTL